MRVAQLMQCTMMTDERPAFGLPHHLLCNGQDFALSARCPQYYWTINSRTFTIVISY
jgi:hypothetical protein